MSYRFILEKGDYQPKVIDTDTGKLIKVKSVTINMQVDSIITADMDVLLYDGDEIDIEIPKENISINYINLKQELDIGFGTCEDCSHTLADDGGYTHCIDSIETQRINKKGNDDYIPGSNCVYKQIEELKNIK